ncbi:hypothetical protein [Marinomonas foliarum]|uniref:Uncharacterized protein n=1 Tax=Marinomonas foliarum TaxID=491950 RepID=A0ABX7IQH6_9GAMM|nr:hypothetical protein [Marinomonas foliarum]QRV24590.1 hypothetical protein JSY38_03370 [Marinomonas foliarum]
MKELRIKHFNQWPLTQEFSAEIQFKERVSSLGIEELFFPYQLPNSNDKDLHICVSYLLDAVDSLPLRPDHAFDWMWRGFEYVTSKAPGGQGNITNALRTLVCPTVMNYFSSNNQVKNAFFELTKNIPFQTCEYLLKRISQSKPFKPTAEEPNLSSYAKRVLYSNGNPPVVSSNLEEVLHLLSTFFDYKDKKERRNGASRLRKLIRLEKVKIEEVEVQLSEDDVLFFLVSGLGYAFRNDRAHAKSIAPFRSSYASVKTYAHCWFMFILFYEVTLIFLHTNKSPVLLTGNLDENLSKNNVAYRKLFGDHINK